MKYILLLNQDKSITRKLESELTNQDIENSKYILVDTTTNDNEEIRNFIMVKPTKLFLFDKAVVDYQFCCTLITNDDSEMDYIWFPPVHVTFTSLSDLLNIINSADRLNLINNLLTEDYSNGVMEIRTCYLQIRLFKKNKLLYDKVYEMNPGSFELMHSSYKVVARFDDIYTVDIMEYFKRDIKMFLYLFKDETWDIGTSINSYELIGIPCNVTNTLTLLTYHEYKAYRKISYYDLDLSIFCEKTENMDEINENLKNSIYTELDEYLANSDDLYYGFHDAYSTHSPSKRTFLMEILTFQRFVFQFIVTLYDELYMTDSNSLPPEYQFNAMIFITIRGKEIGMNLENPIPLIPFLDIIGEEVI